MQNILHLQTLRYQSRKCQGAKIGLMGSQLPSRNAGSAEIIVLSLDSLTNLQHSCEARVNDRHVGRFGNLS